MRSISTTPKTRGVVLGIIAVVVLGAATAIWTKDLGPREQHASASHSPTAASPSFAYLQARPDPHEVRDAVEALTKSANDGDIAAQLTLGKTYFQGLPAIPKDTPRAHDWFARAAAAGNASAAYYLGIMSKTGEGTKPDPSEAIHWLEKAATGGSPHALFELANTYRNGQGVTPDPTRALDYYRRAAEFEHPGALQALAMAYQYGELGLTPDEAESRRYMMEVEHAVQHAPELP